MKRDIQILLLNMNLSYKRVSCDTTGFQDPKECTPQNDFLNNIDRIVVYDEATILKNTQDGPTLHDIEPKIIFCGFLSDKNEDSNFILKKSQYVFFQTEKGNIETLKDALDYVIKESWWSQEKCSGPFIVRYVEEDNQTAMQILRECHP